MSDTPPDMTIVGVVRDGDAIKIIDASKNEHSCKTADELYETLHKILGDKALPQIETRKGSTKEQREKEFDETLNVVGRKIREHIASDYGETVGGFAERTVKNTTKRTFSFLRSISRK